MFVLGQGSLVFVLLWCALVHQQPCPNNTMCCFCHFQGLSRCLCNGGICNKGHPPSRPVWWYHPWMPSHDLVG